MPSSRLKKSTAFAAAAAVVGFSSAVAWAAPAMADPATCGPDGTMLAGNICEQTFTSAGAATFTPNAGVSQLQVLLVAGGGSGFSGGVEGYGGGGGEVKVVDFGNDSTVPLHIVVGGTGENSTVQEGTGTTNTATAGADAGADNAGSSGNGNIGGTSPTISPEGGGGAGASPATTADGGVGVTPPNAPLTGSSNSDFAGDTTCYGGGGAASDSTTTGTASCGGGTTDGNTVTAPTPNSGGGGASLESFFSSAVAGASGTVVVRWVPLATVTLTFDANGHGPTVAPELVAVGTAPAKPADPKAAGFAFGGWYTDDTLTTAADFTAPLTASTTFFAKWTAVASLPTTGGTVDPLVVPLGGGAIVAGLGLVVLARRRRSQFSR